MRNQIVPYTRPEERQRDVIDDSFIRIVNARHDRRMREERAREARRQRAIDEFINNVYYFVMGAAVTAVVIAAFILF